MSDAQALIADSITRMLSDHVDARMREQAEHGEWPADLWTLVEGAGFADLLASGVGGDGDWADAGVVLRALGHHRAPLPLAETMVARWLARCAGLPDLQGPCTVLEQDATAALSLDWHAGTLRVSGEARRVPWARVARWLLVSGRAGSERVLGLIDLSGGGIALERAASVGGEPRDRIRFEDCACVDARPVPVDWLAQPVLVFGALCRAAQMAGALRFLLEQSARYAGEREQFGRPIGRFQAIQQMLAVLAGEVVAAQTAVDHACRAASLDGGRFDVAVAKIRAGQAAGVGAAIAHQVHGAMGFTYEHALHFATRRLWAWRAEYHSEAWWAAQIGRDAIERGGDFLWPWITSHH